MGWSLCSMVLLVVLLIRQVSRRAAVKDVGGLSDSETIVNDLFCGKDTQRRHSLGTRIRKGEVVVVETMGNQVGECS